MGLKPRISVKMRGRTGVARARGGADVRDALGIPKKVHTLEVIAGVEGPCIGLNSIRIAGPKPWGGGKVVATFKVDHEDLLRGIANRKKGA